MAHKWYQDSEGNSSAMRWMAMFSFWMAVLIALVQLEAATKCADPPDLYGLMTTFLGAAVGGKLLQKGFPAGGIIGTGTGKTDSGPKAAA